ncbi:MAG: LytTR family transcriptional regulator [Bacteroidales bacterium]|nr:LytTR family transcriptional regulator [Bacteroidales bacterium]
MGIRQYLATPATSVSTNYRTIAVVNALAVYLILIILQPFGLSEAPNDKYLYLAGFAIITFIGSVVPTALMHRIYKREIEENRYTNAHNVTAFALSVLLIIGGNFLYFIYLYQQHNSITSLFFNALWQTLAITVLIMGVYFAFESAQLRRELRRISRINQKLSEGGGTATLLIKKPATPEKNNPAGIDPTALLYIESDKNYCRITTVDDTSTVRSTLTTMESQLKDSGHIVRCHRAFLVNMANVEGIEGSASSGYKLKIRNHDKTVPVSRTYIADILQYFEK